MSFLLDTDVLSQTIKSKAAAGVLEWIASQRESELHISAITILEVRAGIEQMDKGKRRSAYEHWLEREVVPRFAGRILTVDSVVADEAGKLLGANIAAGRNASATDALIAATARVNRCRVATLNRKHFERLGVELVEF